MCLFEIRSLARDRSQVVAATRRLCYDASYCTEFDATICDVLDWEGKPAVVLDETYFYPTSGGQPNDRGTLNGVNVLDVVEDDERIVHVLEKALAPGAVHGVIDWTRRFDHMQQHTGQHILSQAFERALGAATVSFHLGEQSSTIDIALATLERDTAARVEELANAIVLANAPVTVREYSASEISAVPLRKVPVVHDHIRVVSIADFDVCACGGTHVRNAGEVGSILIRRWERRREQTRVEFLCGWRALRDHRVRNAICQALAGQFSVGVEDLPQAVGRQGEAEQAARRQVEALRKRLLDLELPQLAGEAELIDGVRILCRLLDGYDAGNMRYVAQHLTEEPGMVTLLAVTEPTVQICFARSRDVDLDMARLLHEAVAPHGGRGGGKPHMAQGGGVTPEALTAVLEYARGRLRSARTG
jgi:alanyl-tRNA synthetase